MEQRTSSTARIFATLALVVAVLVAVVLVASAINGGSSGHPHHSGHHSHKEAKRPRTKAKTYTVQPGDTLTAIAHKAGIPVAELQALNPEVDPLTLVAGKVLKLR
jgi:LysM repeat protein